MQTQTCKAPLTRRHHSGTVRHMHLTLEQLTVGERAVVTGYAPGIRSMRERLLSLGLTRGASVQVRRTAPTGCPIELFVRDSSIVLRRSEAAALRVERAGGVR